MPERFGPFELKNCLGHGGTAKVFKARLVESCPDLPVLETGQSYALKIYHQGLWSSDNAKNQALKELTASQRLSHGALVPVHGVLTEAQGLAVVMDCIDGVNLEDFQPQLPYVLPEISVALMLPVLEALEVAHAEGICHRDIKPANIFIDVQHRVFLGDFGHSKLQDFSQATATGIVQGSPEFMSPEQARGQRATFRSDVFSVGAILYFLLSGTRPFSRGNALATLHAVLNEKEEALQSRNPKVSGRLASLVHKALAKNPEERYASMKEFRVALVEYLNSLGLGAAAFPQWHQSPAESTFALLQDKADALASQASRFANEGNKHLLIERTQELSLVAPNHSQISVLMSQIKSNRRRAPIWWWPTGAALLLALIWGGFSFLGASQAPVVDNAGAVDAEVELDRASARAEQLRQARAAERSADEENAESMASAATRDSAVEAGRESQASRPESAISSAPATAPRPAARARQHARVVFDLPEDVQVFWNGKRVLQPRNPLRVFDLGSYTLRMVKPGAGAIEETIEVERYEDINIRAR